jgi:hypothetical protein
MLRAITKLPNEVRFTSLEGAISLTREKLIESSIIDMQVDNDEDGVDDEIGEGASESYNEENYASQSPNEENNVMAT